MTTTTLAIHRGILERRIQRKMVRVIVSGGGCAIALEQLPFENVNCFARELERNGEAFQFIAPTLPELCIALRKNTSGV